jgi:hypothetical protein
MKVKKQFKSKKLLTICNIYFQTHPKPLKSAD